MTITTKYDRFYIVDMENEHVCQTLVHDRNAPVILESWNRNYPGRYQGVAVPDDGTDRSQIMRQTLEEGIACMAAQLEPDAHRLSWRYGKHARRERLVPRQGVVIRLSTCIEFAVQNDWTLQDTLTEAIDSAIAALEAS